MGRLLLLAMVVAPGTASAGRTFYGWLQGSATMPERGAEIGTFISEENRLEDLHNNRDTTWWFAPSIGINDQLELTLPIEFAWDRADNTGPRSTMLHYAAELKYRFVTSDPVDKPAFAPAILVGVNRVVTGSRDVVEPHATLIGTYEAGAFHAAINLGIEALVSPDQQYYQAVPGVGVSIAATDDLRFGVEAFGEFALNLTDDGNYSWFAVGPNLAWTHGRTWISAAYGIGVYKIRDAPKLNWGIAF